MSVYFVDLKRRREQEDREEVEESEEKEEKLQKVRDLNALLKLRLRHAEEARRKRPGPKGPKRRPRTLFDWAYHDYVLSERDFKLRYRVTKESFAKLHEMLKPSIETKNKTKAGNARIGGAVDSRVRLALTLRYIAGAMMNDLALVYRISVSECFESMWRVIAAVHAHPALEITSSWVDNPEKLAELEAGFANDHFKRYKSFSWRGQVGAVDGIGIHIVNPGVQARGIQAQGYNGPECHPR